MAEKEVYLGVQVQTPNTVDRAVDGADFDHVNHVISFATDFEELPV